MRVATESPSTSSGSPSSVPQKGQQHSVRGDWVFTREQPERHEMEQNVPGVEFKICDPQFFPLAIEDGVVQQRSKGEADSYSARTYVAGM